MLAEIDVGHVIAGKYALVRLIGKGAMGEVWLATHNSLGGQFAIKLVKPSDGEEDATAAGRFQFEAQVSAKLSRKTRHIVSVSDHGEENGLAYLVMELLEGESLEARIHMGALTLAETVAIVMQIARALGHAHGEGVFHRDLKPANVFLTKDEDGLLLVKLLDFGIARATKAFRTRSAFSTGKDMVMGTPSYMSPEQARGLPSLDYRCDLWALAVVAYESLTQDIPWEGDTLENIFLSICTDRWTPIRTRRPDLPAAIDAVFARAFAPKLDDRFSSAAEVSDAFEALAAPQAAGPTLGAGASDRAGRAVAGPTMVLPRKRSSSWLLAVVAACATLGVIAFVVVTLTARGTATSAPPPLTTTIAVTTTTSDLVTTPIAPTTAPPITPESLPTAKATVRARAPEAAPPRGGSPPIATQAAPPTAAPSPPPIATHAAPPSTPAAPTTATGSPTRKPIDKSEVF